jgi:hypothetical protein
MAMQRLELKPTHKLVQNYAALRQFDNLGFTHETAVRSGCPNSPASTVGLLAKTLSLHIAANMQRDNSQHE